MREIKFRAWFDNQMYSIRGIDFSSNIFPSGSINLCGADFVSLKDTPLMQYTGLYDKNGKEIYECDILDCGDRIVNVKWHEQCGQWDCDFIRYKGKLTSNGITNADWKYRAEVIGNIYKNPELLKETANE